MSQSLAYHLVVHALEGRAGWTPELRFASAVRHAINGHLPYQRYQAAGLARRRDGVGEGSLDSLVGDFLATDLTPCVVLIKALSQPASVILAYNAYNASARLGVRTTVAMAEAGPDGRPTLTSRREAQTKEVDPLLCKTGTLLIVDRLLSAARGGAGLPQRGRASLAGVARLLGVEHSAAAEVALVFELEGGIPIGQVASRLGCHQRTLERRLRETGLTPEILRQASRLIGAVNRIWSPLRLTDIAMDEGFADLAHMTRAFQTAAGMPPSALRRLALADAAIVA